MAIEAALGVESRDGHPSGPLLLVAVDARHRAGDRRAPVAEVIKLQIGARRLAAGLPRHALLNRTVMARCAGTGVGPHRGAPLDRTEVARGAAREHLAVLRMVEARCLLARERD